MLSEAPKNATLSGTLLGWAVTLFVIALVFMV